MEWLPEAPEEIRSMPKGHPASWQRVLLRELQKDPSIELHIFAIRKLFPRDVIFKSGNATFYCLKAPGSLRAPSLFWVDNWVLKRHIKNIQPDIVHAWGMEQAAGLVASRLGLPYLVSMQGILSWLDGRVHLNRYEKFMAFLEGRLLPKAQKVTVEAGFAVDFLRGKWPSVPVEQIEHAPDPLFALKPRQNDPQKLRFLSIGGVNELKGADLLFRSLAQLAPEIPFELTAIGDRATPLYESLRRELSPSLFERVTFRQGLNPAEMADEMSRATMLIYPTRGDTSPNAVKEAVVHGLPVVSARVGGIPEYLFPDENGVLVNAGDVDSLTAGIRHALQHENFSKGRVDPARLASVREYLSAETMARKFRTIYRTACGWK
jgi:glycosyltransferase involved in cell wall biosynthesis